MALDEWFTPSLTISKCEMKQSIILELNALILLNMTKNKTIFKIETLDELKLLYAITYDLEKEIFSGPKRRYIDITSLSNKGSSF